MRGVKCMSNCKRACILSLTSLNGFTYMFGDIDPNKSEYIKENYFGLKIPISLNNVDPSILNPMNSWKDKDLYISQAKSLAQKFRDNFKLYGKEVDYLINSGPII